MSDTTTSMKPAPSPPLPRVLFVDDEQRVLSSMRMMFRHRFELFLASDGRAALEILDRATIDVIVADQQMPGMSGIELLAAALRRSPRTNRILMTEYSDLHSIEESIRDSEVFCVLPKPCPPSRLRAAIELASDAAPATEALRETAADLVDEISAEPSGALLDPCAHLYPVPTPPMTEQDRATTAILAEVEVATVRVLDTHRPGGAGCALATDGVAVFSTDRDLIQCVEQAAAGRFAVLVASNIVQVIQLLDSREPAVLVTDVAQDRETLEGMIAKLREHRPDLVAIALVEHGSTLDRAWLINRGIVFRFLRKPASRGRCAVALQAAFNLVGDRGVLANPPHAEAGNDAGVPTSPARPVD